MSSSNDNSRRLVTARARRWFAESLHLHFAHHSRGCERDAPAVQLARRTTRTLDTTHRRALVEWFADEVECYIYWLPFDTYAPHSRSTGVWTIDWPRVWSDVKEGIAESRDAATRAQLTEEAERFATLDEWLTAERSGLLAPISLTGGSAALAVDVRARLATGARLRRERWSTTCRVCGDTFRPRRSDAARCAACIATKRKKAD